MYLHITFYLIVLHLLLSLCFGWSLRPENSIASDWSWNYFAHDNKKKILTLKHQVDGLPEWEVHHFLLQP